MSTGAGSVNDLLNRPNQVMLDGINKAAYSVSVRRNTSCAVG